MSFLSLHQRKSHIDSVFDFVLLYEQEYEQDLQIISPYKVY